MRIGAQRRILAREMKLPRVTFASFALAGALVMSAAPVSAAPVAADFYGAPVVGLEAYAPGSIVRREPVPQLDLLGARTERILYRGPIPAIVRWRCRGFW